MAEYTEADKRLFMSAALEEARLALKEGEVPVGCVLVDSKTRQVVSRGRNATNRTKNATRHCELEALDAYMALLPPPNIGGVEPRVDLSSIDLFVTCEPCVMCAVALQCSGVKRVFYGCGNDRFGGCGSVLSFHKRLSEQWKGLECYSGIFREEAIDLLRSFYSRGNPNAPEEKRHRKI
ncbi:putative CMP/dCMP deaminase, zinc-binding [Toxoplasma gondii TgCatPRC2]|uniref:CMP/dCMP deaminase, zinc-binding, putative n=15 Tax=Toxoplasma gondii TaxID=5811 RepID=A0A125YS21_TOXGM|nr:CMP/dCMP deaminase, zinc-binding, putative [Toxoplasma gondii ME49]EPR62740.1 putative CMP/dCMP deaminase, zinc-binding [Toxoplasma gondii GT1]ESS32136.1 putative CMP/dCMP deaminase, zinc-binding [Toxoplasma gondii VEG]KAF4641247.1 putative CMP/dCMP deaminase, zinc-binding [Toxoplasma gondii]KFG34033.1 putative CMP/dCMP deaminase, zinc-binding [Toxoplasma gondii GAB2-2007-GAL-DOM2]KFG40226.1 putative CMP/dCMP deaminase, zinc-binding [Toxoplasma gondii p89]KFG40716.1 putative CMP/dCMP deami|eukprot:XP_002365151.1 CMP/dCMP deaminase, zinc-binding, putative [Toxoplasma gondii ME49]